MIDLLDLGDSRKQEARGKAELRKAEGNKFFAEDNYEAALHCYSDSISCIIDAYVDFTYKHAVAISTEWINDEIRSTLLHYYYCNRALCHTRMENYGLAIIDSNIAINLQPTFFKAYYRRGCAYLCMLKFKEAEKDFAKVISLNNDQATRVKLRQCRSLIKQQKFSKAITRESPKPLHETINLSNIVVESSYAGPVYTANPVDRQKLIREVIEYIKVPGNRLHRKYVLQLILDVIGILRRHTSLESLFLGSTEHLTVCGDIHGQFYDLLHIFDLNGLPSEQNSYLFNGDFIDRGSFSLECATILYLCKVLYPRHFHIVRGNHETEALNKCYGFRGEVLSKYDEKVYHLFNESFRFLPLGYLINDRVLVLHGGLFGRDNVTLDDLRSIDRNREPPEQGLMTDMLWSDPKPQDGRSPSKRGIAWEFGPDVTRNFMQSNGLSLIIRSHEVRQEGYQVEQDGMIVTVFSAPNYCDQMGNKGAVVRLEGADLVPRFIQFEAVAHPPVRAMEYASPLFSGIY